MGPPLAFPLVTLSQPGCLKDAHSKLPGGFLHDGASRQLLWGLNMKFHGQV